MDFDASLALDAGAHADAATPEPDASQVSDASQIPDATMEDAGAPIPDAGVPDIVVNGCTIPGARLGDTPEARALQAAPARCGQRPHVWLDSGDLGAPGMVGSSESYGALALRVAAAAANLALPVDFLHDVVVDQIAYTTQDRGALHTATTLVAYPQVRADLASFDVILLLHGTAGFTDACAPSSTTEARLLAAALASAGYVVAAPDYIGLRAFGGPTGLPHPYLVGQPTAIASLDAVRAAMRHVAQANRGSCATSRFVIIGGSQGGHAALWVDRIGAYYAPELALMGTAATVPPADLVSQTDRALRATVPATANVVAFFGASTAWYELDGRLSEVFRAPYDTSIPEALATSCSPSLRGVAREDLFQASLLASVEDGRSVATFEPWGCLARENGITSTEIPRAPKVPSYGILWVLGEEDTLVDSAIERDSFATLCADGYRMTYLECAGASHTRATTWALPEIIDFSRERLAERPLAGDDVCRVNAPTRCRATR